MDPVEPPSSAMEFSWDLGIVAIGRQLLTKKLESYSSDHRNPVFDTRYPGTPSPQQLPSTGTPLPLVDIPEDSFINMLSYLTSTEFCAVRRASRQFLETADLQAEDLWGRLCYRDFPSMARQGAQAGVPAHQQYIRYVMLRAEEEACNLRSTRDVRESLEAYTCRGGTGVVGMASDIASLPDPLISRAVSRKRRAALWSVVVTDERVIQEFRRRDLHRGPLNFLPIRTLQHDHVALLTAATEGGVAAGGIDRGGREMLLPMAPETPAPAGFLGYVVRLLRLRAEHEHLRWTFFYAIFKDLMVFESAVLAEALRARTPGGHLFYCSLNHVGTDSEPAVMDGDQPLPHISHWGFRPLHGAGGNSTSDGGNEEDLSGAWGRRGREAVADAVERLEQTARYAKSSLAFVRWR